MSKRTRGSARAHRRPGARPAGSRSAVRRRDPAPLTDTSQATPLADDEMMFEVALTDADQAPQPRTVGEGNQRPVRTHHRPRVKPGSLLAARAATEYVYVTHDLKRISLLGVVLFGTLLLLWLLIVALRVIPLPFY